MDYQGRQTKGIGSFTEGQNMTYTEWFLKTMGKKKDFQETYKKILILFLHCPLQYELVYLCVLRCIRQSLNTCHRNGKTRIDQSQAQGRNFKDVLKIFFYPKGEFNAKNW